MKEITIKDFTHLQDATEYLENMLFDAFPFTDELDGEIKYINGQWRVGVTINGRQNEFKLND